jgi:hypothetical protein
LLRILSTGHRNLSGLFEERLQFRNRLLRFQARPQFDGCAAR